MQAAGIRIVWIAVMAVLCGRVMAQVTGAASANTEIAAIERKEGVDAPSGTAYVLISLKGKLSGTPTLPPADSGIESFPRLTAQCTRSKGGKLNFELLSDLGEGSEILFIPPWTPSPGVLFAPLPDHVVITMEFLGYTKFKPVRCQWEHLLGHAGEMLYDAPGTRTSNLEPVQYYLQVLRSLPTLRLNVPHKGIAEWQTAEWQAAVRTEPLCHASGL